MVAYTKHDLQFILDGINVSQAHAEATNTVVEDNGQNVWLTSNIETSRQILLDLIPNSLEPIGMRTIDGSLNNLVFGQDDFGATGEFPRLVDADYRDDSGTGLPEAPIDINGPAPGGFLDNTDYSQSVGSPSGGNVVDSDPRLISNLIVDQTAWNPVAVEAALALAGVDDVAAAAAQVAAAVALVDAAREILPVEDAVIAAAAAEADLNLLLESFGVPVTENGSLVIPNTAPDEGLSAPFNAWMTFFGQFFDHGLDLVAKGGSGTVFIPLQPDDPLIAGDDGVFGTADDLPPQFHFMALTRATVDAGPDGVLGTDDDVADAENFTSPFIDQNQTYTSHSSAQLFVRAYELNAAGQPAATGGLIEGASGGMATWADLKFEAADKLGFALTDAEAISIPLFAVDQYGEFIPAANGLPQLVLEDAGGNRILVAGDLATPVSVAAAEALNPGFSAVPTGHAFLLDIAHDANPVDSQTGLLKGEDADTAVGLTETAGDPPQGVYDNELLDAHFIAGDGRANENFGLTAVHHVFHGEHNRLVEHTKQSLLSTANTVDIGTVGDENGAIASLDLLNGYLLDPVVFDRTDQTSVDAAFAATFRDASDFPDAATYQAYIDGFAWDGNKLFQAAKFGTEMQYQHLVFEEFGRKVQPLIDLFASYETSIDAAIVAEFAHTVYRFGHSMLTETVNLMDEDGNLTEAGLIEAFLNPLGFHQQVDENGTLLSATEAQDSSAAAGAIARGLTRQTGNEIDEFVTNALRDNLLGLPLDLPAINIARGRETGVPTLNDARADFFAGTGDTKLKPYESWVEFGLNLKHEASIINFIAAYGQHSTILNATTLADKRAAAETIVLGGVGAPSDAIDFLNGTGPFWSVNETGLNLVDFWIGGLAEAIEPFGGMLGSTFNFVFEQQMEDLQDGDRFYYLGRTAGLNFLSELEQNSFANMIIRNTDVGDQNDLDGLGGDHLPGDIFSTPAWILEMNQDRQVTGLDANGDPVTDGTVGRGDPIGDSILVPLVIRQDTDNDGDNDVLRYTGGDHVVLGGTAENDTLIGGIGDDTLWGDDGDDNLEGGDGGDILLGGDGDDILTDIGGPNNIQGQEGNDAIFAGGGESLILGGGGQDFILQGPDFAETFGGRGNDFIHSGDESNIVFGGEGDDWLEGGGGNNLVQGDNGDPFLNSTAGGHDVFISGLGDDDYDSEGGDDIMEGADGIQRFEGLNGFDWATYYRVDNGVSADFLLRAFDETPLPPSNVSIMDRFDSVQGLSGSDHTDVLRGGDDDILILSGLNNGNDSMLRNFDLIRGLREGDFGGAFDDDAIFEAGTLIWGEGDIILGGGGSDVIEGRGGGDIIDGDLKLGVRLEATALIDDGVGGSTTILVTAFEMHGDLFALNADGSPDLDTPITTLSGATNLQAAVFARDINPGAINIVREITNENFAGDITTPADFDTAEYAANRDEFTITGPDLDGWWTVQHNSAAGLDDALGVLGTDRVRNIERLQFTDQAIDLTGGTGGNTPATGMPNIVLPGTNTVTSDVTVGQLLGATVGDITDVDGNTNADGINDPFGVPPNPENVSFFWQIEVDPGVWEDVIVLNAAGEDEALQGETITVPPEAEGLALRVRAVFQDDAGVIERVFSEATSAAAPAVSTTPTDGDDIILGTVNDDTIDALAGDDVILALAGDDRIIGGDGNDVIDGGAGVDTAVFDGNIADFIFEITPEGDLEVVGPVFEDAIIVDPAFDGQPTVEFLEFDDGTINLVDRLVIGNAAGDPAAQTIVGSFFDQPTGNNAGDRIFANDGDDTIFALNGDDVVRGQDGNDVIFGGRGNDDIRGGADDDELFGGAGTDDIRGGGGADVIDGGEGDDLITGNGGTDEITGGLGDDTIAGGGADDVIFWQVGDGRDIINGGGNTGAGAGGIGDTVDITTNANGDTVRVFAVVDLADRDAFVAEFDQATLDGLALNTEIVITYDPGDGSGEEIISELDNVEELVVNAVAPVAPTVNADGTTLAVIGNFDNTSLNVNTITFNGSIGNDTVDDTRLTSEHRVVFNANGGLDTWIGDIGPQDVLNTMNGTTVTTIGDETVIDGPEIARFGLTELDLAELKKLVNGQPSDLAEDHATGIRDLEGTGNNVANPDFGSSDQPFIRLTEARYGEYDAATGNRAVNPIFDGLDPRNISDLIGTQESDLPTSAEDANIFFMAFGQYFDHGLDFLPKGGNGTIIIDGEDVSGPPGSGNFADLTRGSVDHMDANGIPQHLNMASPFVDQNQSYGSTELVGQFLREGDGNGGLGSKLLAGAPDPSNTDFNLLPTLRELILHHWENDTVFSDPVHLPAGPMSFREYFTDLPYINSDGFHKVGTLVDGDGNIKEAMIPFVNGDFMGSGYTLVGDANPFINLLDHYVAGDLRANENFALTSMHTIWARNHNYHAKNLEAAGFDGSADELFEAAKILNEAEYQRVVFDEFADQLLGGLKGSGSHGFDEYNPAVDARISHEFAAAAYRFGHSLISETFTVIDANGQPQQVPLTDAFLNPTNDDDAFDVPLPPGYTPQPGYEQLGVNGVIEGITGQPAEEVDYNIVDAVRDDLVRIQADLFSFNVARGWDVGLGPLNQVRADLLKSTDPYVMEAIELSEADLTPYRSWQDFGARNGLSAVVLAQFIAAYPDLTLASAAEIEAFTEANPDIELENGNTVKGYDRMDFWVGGLAEQHINGGMVGSTFWVVLHEQFDRLQEGDRLYYLDRVDDFDFYEQVEDQTFADIVARNTGLEGLPEDIFATDADENNDDDGDGDNDGDGDGDNDGDDSGDGDQGSDSGSGSTDTDAPMTLTGDDSSNTLIGGNAGDMIAGHGADDTLLSGDGDDTVSGGDGDDNLIGGSGNDILIGDDGSDTILGNDGDDFILAGDGMDHVLAGGGNDWIDAGADRDVVDAGSGDDTVVARFGDGDDVYRGGDGTDTYDMSAVTSDVTVDLNLGSATSSQSGTDTITGFENVITGYGDDTIIAGSSTNVMTGGAGNDTFVFNSVAEADNTHITDFAPGDTIDLSGISANYNFGGDGNFELLSDGASFTQAGQLIVRSDGNDLVVEGNVDGGTEADFAIRVSGKSDLDPTDFG